MHVFTGSITPQAPVAPPIAALGARALAIVRGLRTSPLGAQGAAEALVRDTIRLIDDVAAQWPSAGVHERGLVRGALTALATQARRDPAWTPVHAALRTAVARADAQFVQAATSRAREPTVMELLQEIHAGSPDAGVQARASELLHRSAPVAAGRGNSLLPGRDASHSAPLPRADAAPRPAPHAHVAPQPAPHAHAAPQPGPRPALPRGDGRHLGPELDGSTLAEPRPRPQSHVPRFRLSGATRPVALVRKRRERDLAPHQAQHLAARMAAQPADVRACYARLRQLDSKGRPGLRFAALEGPDGIRVVTNARDNGAFAKFVIGRDTDDRLIAFKLFRLPNPGGDKRTRMTDAAAVAREIALMDAAGAGLRAGPVLQQGRASHVGHQLYVGLELFSSTLQGLLAPARPDERLALVHRVARDVGLALDTAHRNVIVHGDVSADNVFVDAQGRMRLGDFGLAQRIDPRTGTVAGGDGKLDHFAPEMFAAERVGRTIDTWGLGVTLLAVLDQQLLGGGHGPSVESGKYARNHDLLLRPDGTLNGAYIAGGRDGVTQKLRPVLGLGDTLAHALVTRVLQPRADVRAEPREVASAFLAAPTDAAMQAAADRAIARLLDASGATLERRTIAAALDAFSAALALPPVPVPLPRVAERPALPRQESLDTPGTPDAPEPQPSPRRPAVQKRSSAPR